MTADLLNLLPFITFSGVGFAALLYQAALPDVLRPLAAGLFGVALGVPVVAAVGWRYRLSLGRFLIRVATPVVRYTPRLTVAGLRDRMRELDAAFQCIATDRSALVRAVAFSYIGWIFFALPLYFAGLAINSPIPLLLVFFIVSASTLAGLVPSRVVRARSRPRSSC